MDEAITGVLLYNLYRSGVFFSLFTNYMHENIILKSGKNIASSCLFCILLSTLYYTIRVCKCLRVWVLYNRVTMNVFVCVRMYVFRLNHNDNLELHEMPAVTATNNKNNNNDDISLPIHLLYVDLCSQLINLSLFPSIYLFLFACHQHQIKM